MTYSLQRGLFGWVLRTDDDWYYRPTEEAARILLATLVAEETNDDNERESGNAVDGQAVDPAHGPIVPGSGREDEGWDRDYS